MKKLIIFDLDGTLLDTLTDLQNSVNFALSQYDFPLKSREDVRKAIGNGVAKLMERSIPKGLANPHYFDCLEIFKKHYSEHYSDATFPYENMPQVINELRKMGYMTAVATNKIDKLAKELIEHNFPNGFDYILGDIDGVPKKPNPDMINNIISHFKLDKNQVIYIGDTNVDEETAINSGLDYVLVSYGYRTLAEIKKTCICRTILSSPLEVLHYFKKID